MKGLVVVGAVSLLGACAFTGKATPLVYVSTQTLGVSASIPGAENPTGSIVIGYKSVDVAVVPVTVVAEAGETVHKIRGVNCGDHSDSCEAAIAKRFGRESADADANKKIYSDALSVIGTFENNTEAKKDSVSNKLGKIFATGVAAQLVGEGIKASLTKQNGSE